MRRQEARKNDEKGYSEPNTRGGMKRLLEREIFSVFLKCVVVRGKGSLGWLEIYTKKRGGKSSPN